MKNENMKKNNKGFSLVELIVVIAIMAVLMVILAPAMLRYVEKTRVQKDESAISEVANAAELALGEESVYTAVSGTSPIVIAVGGANIGDNVSDKVAADVRKTVGDKITFASKAYKGKTVYINLVYSAGKEAYVLKKTSEGKSFAITSSDLVSE